MRVTSPVEAHATSGTVDAKPAAPIGLDDVSKEVTEQIIDLARQALRQMRQANAPEWRCFLAHSV
jgi:hypothetical protein